MLKEWHFFKAFSSTSKDGGVLERQLAAIEQAINALEASDATLMRMAYFEKIGVEKIAAQLFVTPQAVYKRLKTICGRIQYCLQIGGCG
jgi:DNA-directed RNA polymerase specialized sigma24 family protein